MAPTFDHVSLDHIDLEDKTFIVTYRPDMRTLDHSVARMGVLTPLHLRRRPESDRLQVVCGSKRLQASQNAGHLRVPALIYDTVELADAQAFRLAMYDNLGCRPLNVVEKGRILKQLRDDFCCDVTVLVQDVCPLLDLPPRPDTLTTYCTLVTLDEPLQAATVEATLSLETALWVGQHPPEDRQVLLALFTGLSLGRNRAREFATTIEDLCRRDACRPAQLLQDLEVLEILHAAQLNGPQKVERVRHVLRQARYPSFSVHEQHFHQTLRQLGLPSQVHLRPPPYFEGQQYQISFDFHSRQELRQIAQRLIEAAANDAMDDLLSLL